METPTRFLPDAPAIRWPKREKYSPAWWGRYKRFWAGTEWQLFLRPVLTGVPPLDALAAAREDAVAHGVNDHLFPFPGVYEFAICARPGSERKKVYIGSASGQQGVKGRQRAYLTGNGSTADPLMGAVLTNGGYIMRRVRYTTHKPAAELPEEVRLRAKQYEMRFLSKYDWGWNMEANTKKRVLIVVPRTFLCCMFGSRFVEEEYDKRTLSM